MKKTTKAKTKKLRLAAKTQKTVASRQPLKKTQISQIAVGKKFYKFEEMLKFIQQLKP